MPRTFSRWPLAIFLPLLCTRLTHEQHRSSLGAEAPAGERGAREKRARSPSLGGPKLEASTAAQQTGEPSRLLADRELLREHQQVHWGELCQAFPCEFAAKRAVIRGRLSASGEQPQHFRCGELSPLHGHLSSRLRRFSHLPNSFLAPLWETTHPRLRYSRFPFCGWPGY